MKNLLLWIHHKIRNNDMYGKQITFTYKGEEKLKTFAGGILTMLISIALTVTFCTSMYTLINRNNSRTYTKTVLKDGFNETTK